MARAMTARRDTLTAFLNGALTRLSAVSEPALTSPATCDHNTSCWDLAHKPDTCGRMYCTCWPGMIRRLMHRPMPSHTFCSGHACRRLLSPVKHKGVQRSTRYA